MQVDDKLLSKLEKLSFLKVDENKREEMIGQLSEIVSFVDNISSLNTDGVDDNFAMGTNSTPTRQDVASCDTQSGKNGFRLQTWRVSERRAPRPPFYFSSCLMYNSGMLPTGHIEWTWAGVNLLQRSAGWFEDVDYRVVALAVLMLTAIGLRYVPGTWTRRAFLFLCVLVGGVLLNLQYSTQQVMALLSFQLPGSWLSGSFFLAFFVPLLVLFFGNVYCGYVCPFGALQELVGDLRPGQIATDPAKSVWRYGRAVKYVLLLLVVILFSVTWNYAVLAADPLITFFSRLRDPVVVVIGGGVIALSFVFRRFWCRNLCPAGAFLALLCGIRPLKRLRRPTGPARCDLGVRTASELDCLHCDRCRQ